MYKTRTMRSIDGNWLFYEENNGKVYYSLASRHGDLIRKGEMTISQEVFEEAIHNIGYEHPKEGFYSPYQKSR